MNEKMNNLMAEHQFTFAQLAEKLGVSKQTLTRKFNGKTEWTYSEMMVLVELLKIEDPQSFFFTV